MSLKFLNLDAHVHTHTYSSTQWLTIAEAVEVGCLSIYPYFHSVITHTLAHTWMQRTPLPRLCLPPRPPPPHFTFIPISIFFFPPLTSPQCITSRLPAGCFSVCRPAMSGLLFSPSGFLIGRPATLAEAATKTLLPARLCLHPQPKETTVALHETWLRMLGFWIN